MKHSYAILAPFTVVVAFTIAISRCCAQASSAASQETLIGIVGTNFVLLGADSSIRQSIAVTASNVDKITILVDPTPAKNDGDSNQETFASNHQPCNHNNNNNNIDSTRQQIIAVAAAGNTADADRLIGNLQYYTTLHEYEQSIGCDVTFIDCSSNSRTNTPPGGLSVQALAHLARQYIATQMRSSSPFQVCLLVAGMMPTSTRIHSSPLSSSSSLNPMLLKTSINGRIGKEDSNTPLSLSARLQSQIQSASAPFTNKPSSLLSSVSSLISPDHVSENKNSDSHDKNASILQPSLYWLDEYGSMQQLWYGAHGLGSHFILSILDQGYSHDMSIDEATMLMRQCFAQLRTRYVINSPDPPCIKCIDANGCRVL